MSPLDHVRAGRKRAGRGAYTGPACPKCAAAVYPEYIENGRGHCIACELRYDAAEFHPPEPAQTSRPAQVEGQGTAPCARHARNAAVASCERCGSFMCALCRIEADGKVLCAACFERLGSKGELASTRTRYRHYNGMSLHCALLGVTAFWFFAPVLGPIAIFTGLRGLRQGRELGETLGETGARVGIVLGGLEAVGGTIGLLVIFGALK